MLPFDFAVDPYLTSEYVRAYVPALQYDNPQEGTKQHLKVSACCKHFVAYSLENYEDMDRHHFNANVSAQDMTDTYLPAFEVCASPHSAAASCMMCSYNEVNGVPSCANRQLLTDRARMEWGFDGYITSDCGAVEDVFNTHYYAKTPQQAVREVLLAGLLVHMFR
jgi:beta-glucosidase-like glycosyl hydrolase